ncbi:MAG TPA: glycosyltransferase [Steroidobacteraceae bacterium]|nr:glycosyltransferase [Steroidobacteraceae bacterium]
MEDVREVAIFRHNLFRLSEPFIAQQAQRLRRYRPLYLGRWRFGLPPEGAESLALQDIARWRLPRIGWQMITRDPRPYERLMREHRPALIHAHFGIEGVYALPLARRLARPLITTFHGFDATLAAAALLASPAWAQYPLHRRELAREGDLFLCASGFIRERVLAMGFPEARTHTHYIGVDCESIRPREPAEEMPVILHVARLVEVKGTRYLLRAFAEIASRYAEARLVVIGDGPLRGSLQRLSATLGIADRVRFLGGLNHAEVLAWMRRAAMLVLPGVRTATGRIEGLGLVLLEAAATGVPVIGSAVGGIPECVLDRETGFLVRERDVDALAARMGELLDDPLRRQRMGAQGRSLVERRFDARRQTASLEDLYDSVLGRSV